MEDVMTGSADAYAERAFVVRQLAQSLDGIRDTKGRDLVRMAMVRLIASMGPEVTAIKPVLTAFTKPVA